MPRPPGIGQRDTVRVLEKQGFQVLRQEKRITVVNRR